MTVTVSPRILLPEFDVHMERMNNMSKKGKLFLMVPAAMVLVAAAMITGCAQSSTGPPGLSITREIPENETDSAVWGKYYPSQYSSYLKNKEESKTEYGGSVRESKLDEFPYLRQLFAGMGFGEDYNEERGHTYSLIDIREINAKRKPGGTCMTCKSTEVPGLIKKLGVKYYSMPFDEVSKLVKHPIGCLDCHDPKTMALRVTRPAFIEAMRRRGKDVTQASRQELRQYVCAQCHNEYYFHKQSKEVDHPWDNGFEPEDAEKYYNDKKFTDWIHPKSGAEMIKVQHPEWEHNYGGTHYTAGVTCSDCHMPYIREGASKVSSHWWTSPLKTMDQSCGVCHREGNDWLKSRVLNTQKRTQELLDTAGNDIVVAINAIEKAGKSPDVDRKRLADARNLHRRAQFYWDWVSAENSTGFHNPQGAMHSLGKAIDLARQAQVAASQAAANLR